MGLTSRQYQQLLANLSSGGQAALSAGYRDRSLTAPSEIAGKAVGTAGSRQACDRMNRTEKAYSIYLESLRMVGVIAWWGFEVVKLRLANRTFYTPDFNVIYAPPRPDLEPWAWYRMEFHEIKGFWRDDARVKFKVAAEQFPWARFIAVKRDGQSWQTEVA